MTFLRSIIAVSALAVLAAPDVAPAAFGPAESGLPAQGTLSQLRGMQELKSWFNTFNGHPRLILLLSPT